MKFPSALTGVTANLIGSVGILSFDLIGVKNLLPLIFTGVACFTGVNSFVSLLFTGVHTLESLFLRSVVFSDLVSLTDDDSRLTGVGILDSVCDDRDPRNSNNLTRLPTLDEPLAFSLLLSFGVNPILNFNPPSLD